VSGKWLGMLPNFLMRCIGGVFEVGSEAIKMPS
jgi:hypothetical protein